MRRVSIPCQALRAASSKSKNKRNRKASPSQAQAAAAAALKPMHPIAEALDLVKSGAKAKFDETVEVINALCFIVVSFLCVVDQGCLYGRRSSLSLIVSGSPL